MSREKLKTISFLIWQHHDPPYVIHKSIYIPCKHLMIFRAIASLFFLSIIIWMITDMKWKYFLFVTNWGFFLGFLFFSIISIENVFVKNSYSFCWKFCHILFEVAVTIEFMIVIFYWVGLFYLDYDKHKDDSDFSLWLFNDICIHFIGFFFLWIDNVFNHIKIYRKHFLFVISVMVCYLVVNCAYTLGVENIYPPITWVDFISYICGLIILVLLIIHHYFAIWFFEKIKKKRIDHEEEGNNSWRTNILL